jgi:hypothetical protein
VQLVACTGAYCLLQFPLSLLDLLSTTSIATITKSTMLPRPDIAMAAGSISGGCPEDMSVNRVTVFPSRLIFLAWGKLRKVCLRRDDHCKKRRSRHTAVTRPSYPN